MGVLPAQLPKFPNFPTASPLLPASRVDALAGHLFAETALGEEVIAATLDEFFE